MLLMREKQEMILIFAVISYCSRELETINKFG
jgi:hypothetical protein